MAAFINANSSSSGIPVSGRNQMIDNKFMSNPDFVELNFVDKIVAGIRCSN